jgi:hypothetical protein
VAVRTADVDLVVDVDAGVDRPLADEERVGRLKPRPTIVNLVVH